LAGAIVFSLLAVLVFGTTVVPPSFDKLVSDSDYIVRAVVKSVVSEMRNDGKNRHIITKIELDVREVINGNPPQQLVLEMLGGKVGVEEMVVEGSPKFQVGDEDVLFIRGNKKQFNPLVALMFGRYPIKREARTGREYVVRTNGAALYDEKEVSLPMSDAGTQRLSAVPDSQPLSVTDFVSRIRTSARNSPRSVQPN
jgi:hypothetical protein